MNADAFTHKDSTATTISCFLDLCNEPGPGGLESVYEKARALPLEEAGLATTAQEEMTVRFRGVPVGVFRTDLLEDGKVLIEIKASRSLDSAREAQLLNDLKATELGVGLLLNFGPRPQFKRLAFENSRKRSLPDPLRTGNVA